MYDESSLTIWWFIILSLGIGTVSSLHADPVVTHLGFQLCEPYINPSLRNLTLRNLFLFQIVLCM